MASTCVAVILVISLVLLVYGFLQLFQREKSTENDVQVVQRQLRGLGCLLLSQVILVLGVSLCMGQEGLADLVRSLKMM